MNGERRRVLYIEEESFKESLDEFGKRSPKTAHALEKLLYQGKLSLSQKERNLLHKFKKKSLEEIEGKIKYLHFKRDIIKLLNKINF
jgi:hypothetical protein